MTTFTRCDRCQVERVVHTKDGLVGWVVVSIYPGPGKGGVRDTMRSLDLCRECAELMGLTKL